MLNRLGQLRYPIPKPLRAAASAYLDHHLRHEIARLGERGGLEPIRGLMERGRAWGYQPEASCWRRASSEALERTLGEIDPEADLAALTARAGLLLDAAALLGIPPDLWQVQNRLLDAFDQISTAGTITPRCQDVRSARRQAEPQPQSARLAGLRARIGRRARKRSHHTRANPPCPIPVGR